MKTGQPARVRAQLDQAYEDRRSQFQSLLELSQGTNLPFWADAWLELMKQFRERVEAGLRSGALDFAAQTVDPYDPEGTAEAQAYMRHSAFHRVHLADRDKRSARNRDLTFNVFRTLLNLQYLYLTRLGITPWQRTFLGHLIANAVEEREQISAATLYERFRYTPSLPTKPRL